MKLLVKSFDTRPPDRLALDLIFRNEDIVSVRQQLNPLRYPVANDGPSYPAVANSLQFSVVAEGGHVGPTSAGWSDGIDRAVPIGGGWKVITVMDRMTLTESAGQQVLLGVMQTGELHWEGGWFFGGAKLERLA